jgi:hypothetical protein
MSRRVQRRLFLEGRGSRSRVLRLSALRFVKKRRRQAEERTLADKDF